MKVFPQLNITHRMRGMKLNIYINFIFQVSLHFLDCLNVPFLKIGSGDANNLPLIHQAALTQRPLVISTGKQFSK